MYLYYLVLMDMSSLKFLSPHKKYISVEVEFFMVKPLVERGHCVLNIMNKKYTSDLFLVVRQASLFLWRKVSRKEIVV